MAIHNIDFLRLNRIVEFLQSVSDFEPEYGLILGTGLNNLISSMEISVEIDYEKIPNFPRSTVKSHSGKLIFGTLSGKQLIVFSGRFHFYEGYTMQEVTLPVRIMQMLQVKTMIISNAAGGLNPQFEAGDIVSIYDHINFFPANPLRGVNSEKYGVRFPDMLHAYDKPLIEKTLQVAQDQLINIKKGVYLGVQGPSMETPAEYRMYRALGADLVGMSTVPEVIVANHANIKVLGFSVVSNICFPIEKLSETTLEEVISTVEEASPNLIRLIKNFLLKNP